MNATEFINALNDGQFLDCPGKETLISQDSENGIDKVTIIGSVISVEIPVDVWGVSPKNPNLVELFYQGERKAAINAENFRVME